MHGERGATRTAQRTGSQHAARQRARFALDSLA
jgi:hypothetical protein